MYLKSENKRRKKLLNNVQVTILQLFATALGCELFFYAAGL